MTWLRWSRATTVATAATLVAMWAHLSADERAPSSPVLAFLVLALTAAIAPFLARPASITRIVLLTVVAQFGAHTTLALAAAHEGNASTATDLTSARAPVVSQHAHTGTAAGDGLVAQLSDHVFAYDTRMLLTHIAAAVVVGAWLAAGERAVWTLVTHIWRSLVLPVMPLATPEAPSAAAVPSVVETMLLRLWVGSVGRRGPPHLLAI